VRARRFAVSADTAARFTPPDRFFRVKEAMIGGVFTPLFDFQRHVWSAIRLISS
jgi:hypothetical protein